MTVTEILAFGELLRRHRRTAGLTQEELAERATLSVRAISDLERGLKYRPRKDTVQLLADALELDGEERAAFWHAARQIGGSLPSGSALLQSQEADPAPAGLQDEATPFIGRERELAEVAALLQQRAVRLLTLTGTGGTGKTRLALRVVARLASRYEGGVCVVSLAPLADPALVPSTVASALGIKEREGQPLLDTVREHLSEQRLLLVLDNFEHLLAAAPVVGSLLAGCSGLQVLVTSRTPLHLSWEHEYPVPPLSVPAPEHLPDLATLFGYEAIALFVERARAVMPGFALTDVTGPVVAEICRRLDGLPLAIELAAARVKLLPPQLLLHRLGSGLALLTGGARDYHPRQRTLRNTIDWSHSLLSPDEQALFARLSVFAGGCTLEAAEAVCILAGDLDVLEGLSSLIDQSLVQHIGDTESRFTMLETIREYATERLEQSEDAGQVHEAHVRYYLQMARDAVGETRAPQIGEWLRRLQDEQPNIRAALAWLRDRGDPKIGLELVTILGTFHWLGGGHLKEGVEWFKTFLDQYPDAGELRFRALECASHLAFWRTDLEEARRFAEEGVRLARELGEVRENAMALTSLPRIMIAAGNLGGVFDITQEGIELAQSVGATDVLARHLLLRAESMRAGHNYAEARTLYTDSLELYRGLDRVDTVVINLGNLSALELDAGNLERAEGVLREKAELAGQLQHAWLDGNTLLSFARLAAGRHDLARAARLLSASNRMFESIRLVLRVERAGYDSTLALLSERLPEGELSALWEEGQAMSLDDALAYAVQGGR